MQGYGRHFVLASVLAAGVTLAPMQARLFPDRSRSAHAPDSAVPLRPRIARLVGAHDPPPLRMESAQLTGWGPYQMLAGSNAVTAIGTSDDRNVREVFWRPGTPPVVDGESCAEWLADDGGVDQEGAALRIHRVPNGVRAITVTKNVFLGAHWIFNVHVFDTSSPTPLRIIDHFDLSKEFRASATVARPLPWRMCARARGQAVEFRAWPAGAPEPPYGDPRFGGAVIVPPGWAAAGVPGWYVGHLERGGWAMFAGLSTHG